MDNEAVLRKTLAPHWRELSLEEAKLVILLFWLADPDSHELTIPLFKLARQVNMPPKLLITPLRKLADRSIIKLHLGGNPLLDTNIKILSKSGPIPLKPNVIVNVNDPLNVKRSFKKDDKRSETKRSVTASRNSLKTSPSLSAGDLAKAFGDEKNQALYESYCKRFSAEIIQQAYEIVCRTPKNKIKKNPGAYFTFLVKRLSEKN